MGIPAYDYFRFSCACTFQYAIVSLISLNNRDSLYRFDVASKLTDARDRLPSTTQWPLEFALQYTVDFGQNRLRDEQLDVTSASELQYFIWHSAEVQGGNINVGICDDPEQSSLRPVFGDQALDIRLLNAQFASLRATKLPEVPPATVRQISPERFSQQVALGASFSSGSSLRLTQQLWRK
jgi:hypothetical protein